MNHTHTKFFKSAELALLKTALLIFSFLFVVQAQDETYIQSLTDSEARESRDPVKPLSFSEAIEQALRTNQNEVIRKYEDRVLELDWKDAHQDFWFPKLQMSLETTPQRLGRIRNGSRTANRTDKLPAATLGIGFEDYTLFNWGKDFLDYLNTQETNQRSRKVLKEQRRNLKHTVMIAYFKSDLAKRIVKWRKEQLRHASFVYRFNKERLSVGKLKRQDFLRARAEFLKAQNDFQSAKILSLNQDEELATLINDDVGTRYLLSDRLDFKKIKTTVQESLSIAGETNPDVLNAKTSLENATRAHVKAKRELLPLPKISINLGAYNHHFGSSARQTRFETSTGSSDVEVVATLNATWTLWGSGGLLNRRTTAKTFLRKNQAQEEVSRSKRNAGLNIRQRFKNILNHERQKEILESRLPTLRKTFDVVLENYLNKKADFNDFTLALNELIESEIFMVETLFQHFSEKVLMANAIGIEDFPGENFETLANPKRK